MVGDKGQDTGKKCLKERNKRSVEEVLRCRMKKGKGFGKRGQ